MRPLESKNKTLVGIPCLYGYEHTKAAIDSVVNHNCDVLLIDNGAEESVGRLLMDYNNKHKNVLLLRNEQNIYVNPSWNQIMLVFLGFQHYERLCIMNSDLVLHPSWLDCLGHCSVAHPNLIPTPNVVSKIPDTEILYDPHVVANEGIAGVFIVLNKEQVNMVYPIPSGLRIWFGDNWIYDILRNAHYSTAVFFGLLATHGNSQNVSRVKEAPEIIEEDKKYWAESASFLVKEVK